MNNDDTILWLVSGGLLMFLAGSEVFAFLSTFIAWG